MKRMLDSTSNEFALAALRSGRGDQPSGTARESAARALGVATGAAVMTTATSASAATNVAVGVSGAGGVAGAGGGASTVGLLASVPLAVKAVTLGVAVLAVLATTVVVQQRSEPTTRTTTAPGVVATPVRERVALGPSPAVLPTAAPLREPQATATTQEVAEARSAGRRTVPSGAPRASVPLPTAPVQVEPTPLSRPDDLAVGMSMLESARGALASGDARRALSIVGDYQRRFPDGTLGPEGAVLQIEALAASGAKSDALAAADQFLSASPDSPHARHVRAIVLSLRAPQTNP